MRAITFSVIKIPEPDHLPLIKFDGRTRRAEISNSEEMSVLEDVESIEVSSTENVWIVLSYSLVFLESHSDHHYIRYWDRRIKAFLHGLSKLSQHDPCADNEDSVLLLKSSRITVDSF